MFLSKIFNCCNCGGNSGSGNIQYITNNNTTIYSNNAALLALNFGNIVSSASIVLPAAPSDGQIWSVNSAYAITLLTLSATYLIQGYTVPFYFAGYPSLTYQFSAAQNKWLIL